MVGISHGNIRNAGSVGPGTPVVGGMLRKYDPTEVYVTFGGIPIEGFSSGTFLTATRNQPTYSMKVGIDGEVVRVRTNNTTGTVTLTLEKGSRTNDILAGVHTTDELAGAIAVPFGVFDFNGSTLIASPQAWIRTYADITYGDIDSPVVWTFDCTSYTSFVGGLQGAQ